MAVTKDEITRWLKQGKAIGATHLIVVCDKFDWEDYPVFVLSSKNAQSKAREYGRNDSDGLPTFPNKDMQKVMEVYSLSHDWNTQLNEFRAFHFD